MIAQTFEQEVLGRHSRQIKKKKLKGSVNEILIRLWLGFVSTRFSLDGHRNRSD